MGPGQRPGAGATPVICVGWKTNDMEIGTIMAVMAAGLNGAAFLGFWVWARSQLITQAGRISTLEGGLDVWRKEVDARCTSRGDNIGKLFDKFDDVKGVIAKQHVETVRAITELTGQFKRVEERLPPLPGVAQT